jgi:hypothetical protein
METTEKKKKRAQPRFDFTSWTREQKRAFALFAAALCAVLLAVALITFFIVLRGPERVMVPDVRSMDLADALVIAPCTGATLARLAEGLSDTPVTLAAKSLLRVGCPVVIAVSTNDGLGASGENIARLYQRKHYYFVPYGQDDPNTKPQSLKARFELLPQTLEAALEGRQLQPVLQCPCG